MPSGSWAANASFDCRKAATWSEIQVCRDDELAGLDRQMVQIYTKARAGVTEKQKKTLTNEQRAWLLQRDNCELVAEQAKCLRKIYQTRIAHLSAAGRSEGSGESAAQAHSDDKGKAGPQREITPNVVWRDADDVFSQCEHADFECVVKLMRARGASEEAVRFVQKEQVWVLEFKEFGSIDLLLVETFRANTNQFYALVNGSPKVVYAEGYELTPADKKRSDVQALLARSPDAFVIAQSGFTRHESVNGGSRFVFTDFLAVCRACERLAAVELAYDFDATSSFKGVKLLKIKALEK